MIRSFAVSCLGSTLSQVAYAATSTIYAADPNPVIAPTSTSTFKSPSLIALPPASPSCCILPCNPCWNNSYLLSPDGTQASIAGSQNAVYGVGVVDTSTLAVTDFISGASGGNGGETLGVTTDGDYV